MFDAEATIREADAFSGDLRAIRQDLHRHPEIAFKETRTAAVVAAELRKLGIEVVEGVGRTGVVATLHGNRPGQRAIGLRADMDALAIEERSGVEHTSTIPGMMHACGHDGHTTMLLGAARYLAAHRDDFGGTVHLIFQPAEEGHAGAKIMIEDGLFERFPCDAVYGLHNKPGIPFGVFSTKPGPMLAASDSWTITLRGPGGHGGSGAHLAADLSIVAAHIMLDLQVIIARNVPSSDTAVLSVGHISGGRYDAPNVMPAEIVIRGTARSYTPKIRDLLERRMTEIATGHALAQGAKAEVDYQRRYPPMVNHADQVEVAARAAAAVAGDARVITNMAPGTGAEDFSYMLERKPGAFMFLGSGDVAPFHNLHSAFYDFNDELLPVGVAYWASVVAQELGGEE